MGKSCIVLRFVRGQFDPKSKARYLPTAAVIRAARRASEQRTKLRLRWGIWQVTVGAAFLAQTVALPDGCTVKFEIWDTAGQARAPSAPPPRPASETSGSLGQAEGVSGGRWQERYASLAPLYYRGASAAAVVYDITNGACTRTRSPNGCAADPMPLAAAASAAYAAPAAAAATTAAASPTPLQLLRRPAGCCCSCCCCSCCCCCCCYCCCCCFCCCVRRGAVRAAHGSCGRRQLPQGGRLGQGASEACCARHRNCTRGKQGPTLRRPPQLLSRPPQLLGRAPQRLSCPPCPAALRSTAPLKPRSIPRTAEAVRRARAEAAPAGAAAGLRREAGSTARRGGRLRRERRPRILPGDERQDCGRRERAV